MTPPQDRRMILVIEDDETLNALLVEQLERLGHMAQGVTSRAAAIEVLGQYRPDAAILDLRLPDAEGMSFLPELREYCPTIVLTALSSIDQAVKAVRAGAADFLVKPASSQVLDLALRRVLDTADLRSDLAFWQGQAGGRQARMPEGNSAQMAEVRRVISLFAGAATPVLVLGGPGAGKERVARAIHSLSQRANGRFVAASCEAGLSAEDLYGQMSRDLSGRISRNDGLLSAADTGTIYLSGVERLPAEQQHKLLRVIETGGFRPVGSPVQIPCRARFVIGSEQSAEAIAAGGASHSELLFRMLPFTIRLPDLAERPADILPLARDFLDNRGFQHNAPKRFSPAAERAMMAHGWPRNLRELSNAVERSVILSAGSETILPEHLGLAGDGGAAAGDQVLLRFDHPPTLDELRDAYLRIISEKTGGNRREMAAQLGISERNLYRLLPALDAATDERQ